MPPVGERGMAITLKSRLGPRLTAALVRSEHTSADLRVRLLYLSKKHALAGDD